MFLSALDGDVRYKRKYFPLPLTYRRSKMYTCLYVLSLVGLSFSRDRYVMLLYSDGSVVYMEFYVKSSSLKYTDFPVENMSNNLACLLTADGVH